ncbi:hypothetical protein RvY_11085 [Ramazzottius varieornatus]|uniref:Lysophospholipid acyltransferase 7 n=1 Tax=Ramazzottius varieornatus TaxID=947166 RepID=A0A1D1VH07_RAMVA|nr:hypothetical protein RvY_11085 [Ramazzottius varieornatus]
MKEEYQYFATLIASVALGWVVARLPLGLPRQWMCSAAGLLLLLFFCGAQTIHTLITIGVNAVMILTLRDCHIWSMMFTFGYLAFFRSVTYFGLEDTNEFCNAVQLILTLKTIGVAFEVHDTQLRSRGLAPFASNSAAFSCMNTYMDVSPSFMDIVHYCLCYIGLMTGPYFKFKTYDDMIHSSTLPIMPRIKMAQQRLAMLPVYLVCFLTMSSIFRQSMLWDDSFYEETSFVYRYFYMVALFVFFRMKFYIAWLMSESACIMAGLGLYPAVSKPKPGYGPTEPEKLAETVDQSTEFSYETIYNIDEYEVEFVPTVRGAMKAWNMTVQYWLAWHVYRRVPLKSIRTAVVMFVSAYWHGLHGGYYISLLTVPLMLAAEDWVPENAPRWGKAVNWFMRMRAFEYMSMGFMCLTYARTMRYWGSIYFIGHIVATVFLVAGKIYRHTTRRRRLQDEVDATARVAARQSQSQTNLPQETTTTIRATQPDKLHAH